MELSVYLLGTSGSIPTLKRSLPVIAIRWGGEIILFDCGEGAQMQMVKAGLSIMKVSRVFITHLHGDHFLGLAGIVQTMSLWNRKEQLEIYCPRGYEDRLEKYLQIPLFTITFDIRIRGLEPGSEVRGNGYRVVAGPSCHALPALAYAFIEDDRPGHLNVQKAMALGLKPGPELGKLKAGEPVLSPGGRLIRPEEVLGPTIKGRKIVYTGDTKPTSELIEFCRNADLLIHDSTFAEEHADKAEEDFHSTCVQAAEVANKAKVKKLILIHISPRYDDETIMVRQARRIFPNTYLAYDLMRIDL